MTEYLRPFHGRYVRCSANATRAFAVRDETAAEWDRLCAQAGHGEPRDWAGRRLRPYPELNVASHAPYAYDGVYVDHRDPQVEAAAYEQRDRVLRASNGERQAVLQGIADTFGLRHWRDAYNTVRNVGRRHTGEDGRDAAGQLRWRRWNSTYSRQATTHADRPEASGFRSYGIEIEFTATHRSAVQAGIARGLASAGITHHVRWGDWHRAAGIPGWHCTYDSTVAGEVISDIMDGSPESRSEVAAVLRIVRDAGGRPGPGQGMHVHHDVRDFDLADKVRLVDNLAACQGAMLAFVGNRTASGWCRPMADSEFASARRSVAAGHAPHNDHSVAWNLGHLFGQHRKFTVEFRALGNTLNGRKVRAWVQMGQAFMAATKAGHLFPPVTTTGQLLVTLRQFGMSQWAADVFADRCGITLIAA